jgi:hypothetical protein
MYERASRESFTLRFYKTGDSAYLDAENVPDKRFKEVEWFSTKQSFEP